MRGWEEQGKAVNPDRSNVAQEGNPGLPAGSRRGETLKERAFWIQVMEKRHRCTVSGCEPRSRASIERGLPPLF